MRALPAVVATSLHDLVHSVGLYELDALLEAEQTALRGPCYRHHPQRGATRHGLTQGDLVWGVRRVRVRKPRVGSVDAQEVIAQRPDAGSGGVRLDQSLETVPSSRGGSGLGGASTPASPPSSHLVCPRVHFC